MGGDGQYKEGKKGGWKKPKHIEQDVGRVKAKAVAIYLQQCKVYNLVTCILCFQLQNLSVDLKHSLNEITYCKGDFWYYLGDNNEEIPWNIYYN